MTTQVKQGPSRRTAAILLAGGIALAGLVGAAAVGAEESDDTTPDSEATTSTTEVTTPESEPETTTTEAPEPDDPDTPPVTEPADPVPETEPDGAEADEPESDPAEEPPADRPARPTREQLEAFHACMADNGVNLPPLPELDEDGRPIRPSTPPAERPERPDPEAFEQARQACSDLLPEGAHPGRGPGRPWGPGGHGRPCPPPPVDGTRPPAGDEADPADPAGPGRGCGCGGHGHAPDGGALEEPAAPETPEVEGSSFTPAI